MLTIAIADIHPGMKVLDMCAAPGGKTSQLAAALRGEGLLVANEYVAARAGVLKSNLERMGVTNALVLNESTARVAAAFPAFFDKVLVDAPCSGEGMFRKEPEALRQHSAALVAQCAALGASILDDAAAALRPGGLLYSTCTFAPEEDEAQVGAFLARHPEFTVLPAPTNAGAPGEAARCGAHPFAAEHTRRIYPCHGGEGHFMALLQKRGDGAPPEAETVSSHMALRAAPQAAGRARRGMTSSAVKSSILRKSRNATRLFAIAPRIHCGLAPVTQMRCHPAKNQIMENYCSGVYLSPNQVLQILRDLEQEPKVLEDLEKHWSDGQFAVLKKALTAAAELGTGLLEATEVVEPNPLHPNESTCYSNLFHCDRDGVYLYIDMAMKQIAQAMEQNKSDL